MVLGFIAFHLMPVWIYLFGVLTVLLKYKNAQYIVTDKGVYISNGVFPTNYEMITYEEITSIRVHRGTIDQMMGAGDVILTTKKDNVYRSSRKRTNYGSAIESIHGYIDVFDIINSARGIKDNGVVSPDSTWD
jgi:uncharacterized membrane protein YdbT with pleckstrin-like domain